MVVRVAQGMLGLELIRACFMLFTYIGLDLTVFFAIDVAKAFCT